MANAKNTTHTTLKREYFGEFGRYCLTTLRTRFGTTAFHVTDAERIDPVTDLPAVIRQADTREEALRGLL